MPELPEVETIANGVNARIRGAQIVSVWTSGKPQTFKSPEMEIEAVLTGSTIEGVRRVGKTIVVSLQREDQKAEFLVHLGMTGRLLVAEDDIPKPPHTHAVLTLEDGRELRFVDPRRFGRLSVAVLGEPHASLTATQTGASREAYAGPGVEPTTIGDAEFAALFKGRKLAIKAALLNQSLLHGVGNIYADESLFRAGIRPRRQAGRLTRAELARLREALQKVLARAIKLGGSSVSDYVDAEGMKGYFQIEHNVYGRGGEPCKVCGTPIRKIIVGGRGTHFCPVCQR
ncbi:bifunctional DNA-formamidopyrimidine glycosylase/DNA-(apurinic or apyrimidinic site) lyase [soil metagenome]